MNTGRADAHLDLEDLIAKITGQAIDDRAREHLTRCEQCQLEANRWNLVAGGVRDLTDATPQAAQSAPPRRIGRRVLADLGRRKILVASVAAALVLLGGVSYAISAALTPHASGTELTAVNGCATLEQATGTLEQVNGTSLVIKTASGQLVTVTTAASTFMSLSGSLLSEITDGATVDVRGSSSDGTIAAAIVTVGPPFSAVNPPGLVAVRGTVADASTAGFTLVTSAGTRVPVTTSGDTLVIVPHASPGQLPPGATIFALGQAGPDGTLSARAVAAIRQLPAGGHLNVSFRSCSPSSIAAALALGG